jgi:hypothetical protein
MECKTVFQKLSMVTKMAMQVPLGILPVGEIAAMCRITDPAGPGRITADIG